MQPEKPGFLAQPVVKNIVVYRNGDPFYEGRRLVINEKRVSSLEMFLREVTVGVQAPFGAVRNIYTPRAGHRVSSMEHIRSGERYVAAGRERFKKLDYSQIGSKKKRMNSNNAGQVKHMPRKRITATARFLKPLKEPCLIFVAANGDVLNPAVRLLIPQQTLGQFERVLEMITEKMSLRVLGGVHSLYTFNGVLVNDGKDLENGQFYVAVGREKFKKLPYSDLIFTKPARRKFTGSKAASLPPIYGMEKLNDAQGRHQSKSMVGCSDSSGSKASPGPRSNKEAQSQEHLMRLRPGKSGLTLSFGTRDVEDGDQTEDGSGGDPHPEEGWNGRVPTGQNQVESANENEGTLEGDGGRKEGTSKDGKGNTPPEVNGMDVQDSPEAKGREEKSEEGDDTPSSSADGKLEMTEEVVGGSGSDNALSGEKEETIPDSSQEEAGLNGLEGESECEEGAQSVEDAHGYEDASQNGDGERQEA